MKVPEYIPDVSDRPINQQDFAANATPDAFGAGIGRGMGAVAQGLGNFADAAAQVKVLEDETLVRDRRNKAMVAQDEAQAEYGNTSGEQAVSGFDGFTKRLTQIRSDYAAGLTPAQQKLFSQAMDADDVQRKRARC